MFFNAKWKDQPKKLQAKMELLFADTVSFPYLVVQIKNILGFELGRSVREIIDFTRLDRPYSVWAVREFGLYGSNSCSANKN